MALIIAKNIIPSMAIVLNEDLTADFMPCFLALERNVKITIIRLRKKYMKVKAIELLKLISFLNCIIASMFLQY